jgi:hypothetical protein
MRIVRIVILGSLLALLAGSSAKALDIVQWPDVVPPDGVVGQPYLYHFEAEEGCAPYRFEYDSGQLPPGLTVTEDGKLIGIPTEAGLFEFYVALNDHVGGTCRGSPQSEGFFKVIILRALTITNASLQPARVGSPYSVTLEPSDSNILEWSVSGTLPPGLSFSGGFSNTATISGTPSAAGSYTFTATASDLSKKRTASNQYTLVVASTLAASSGRLATGEVGVSYARSLAASGGAAPFHWTVTAGVLPAGLTLDAATGAIHGTPRAAGSFRITFSVADASGQRATGEATLPIAARLRITTTSLTPAVVGDPYSATLRKKGGLGHFRWKIVKGTLPPRMKLDPRTGKLTGTPSKTGTYQFTTNVTDRVGGTSTKRLTLVVTG